MGEEDMTISVIIPFKDKAELTLTCVDSLFEFGTSKHDLEVVLVSNNSSQQELRKVKDAVVANNSIRLLEYNHPFNYQEVNNWGVKQSNGEIILFLNNDTELTEASIGLLDVMVRKAQGKNIGAVGALLLYGDAKHVQHAGVFLRPGGNAEHLYMRRALNSVISGVEYPLSDDRRLTAVTGAVLMVERRKFDEVGGFDQEFILCGGDVDLCIRLDSAGYQTWLVSAGGKYILHKESMTRVGTKIPYVDYVKSYQSYITAFDFKNGDKYLPKASKGE